MQLNRLDRLLAYCSPALGAKRAALRVYMAEAESYRQAQVRATRHLMGGTGPYEAGKRTEQRASWEPNVGSADRDIIAQLPLIRARCRELVANDGNAVAMIRALCDNVVGEGLTPEPKLDPERLGLTPEQTRELQRDMLYFWGCFKETADATGVDDFDRLQELWFQETVTVGDVFPRPVTNRLPGAFTNIAIETIESERVDTPMGLKGDRVIRGGVETNKAGAPVAYWVHRQHPKDIVLGKPRTRGDRNMVRVPKWNPDGSRSMLHYINRGRVRQSRGLPWLTASLPAFKDHSDYQRAEMFAAKIASCLTGIVTSPAGNLWNPTKTSDGAKIREFRPGMFIDLQPGESITIADPKRPNANFGEYSMAALRKIGGALGLSYELALRDFSKSSWANARAAVIEARKMFRKLARQFGAQILQPIWLIVMEEAFRRGMLRHLKVWDAKLMRAVWHHAGWEWVDPQKAAQATNLKLEAGLTTMEKELRAMGAGSYEDLLTQQIYEANLKASLSEALSEVATATTADPDPAQEPEPTEGEEPTEPTEPASTGATQDTADAKAVVDAYGAAVRSGAVTPQQEDEEDIRSRIGLPDMGPLVVEAWEREGTRRPATLASPADNPAEQPADDDPDPDAETEAPEVDVDDEEEREERDDQDLDDEEREE